jgi:hypothetical protein
VITRPKQFTCTAARNPAHQIIAGPAAETSDEPGGGCQYGVARGETSPLIAEHIRADGHRLHLYDIQGTDCTYSGGRAHPRHLRVGSMAAYGVDGVPMTAVQSRLAAIDFPRRLATHEGFVGLVDSGN